MGLFDSWKVKVNCNLRHTALYPGNIMEGVVELNVSSAIPFNAVRLKVTGKERVHIRRERQSPDPNDPPVVENFRESCVVFKQLVTLAGAMKTMPGGSGGIIPAGTFYYPFAFQLPTNIPPSFSKRVNNDFAEIVYYVKTYVDIPMGRDANHHTHFAVLLPMPATQHNMPMPFNVDRRFTEKCCWCVDDGSVSVRMYMDRTLIAIDRDNLMVCCDIDNIMGTSPVESVEISLINNLTYKADYITEKNRVVAGKHFLKQQIQAGDKHRVAGVIPLPRDIVPSLTTFNVRSEYMITIELNIPWATDPCQNIDVIVAQSVDETNFSPQVFYKENKYSRLKKGQFTHPELYYQPPPSPVYQCVPIPLPPPPSANFFTYHFDVPPIGIPSTTWEAQNRPMVSGQQVQSNNTSIHWNSGFNQAVCANSAPPPVGAPAMQPYGDVKQPLLNP